MKMTDEQILKAIESGVLGLMQTNRLMQADRLNVAYTKVAEMLAERNAARSSEGKDGAVAWIVPSARVTSDGSYEDGPESLVFESEATDYIRRIGAPLYTRPAAQVEAVAWQYQQHGQWVTVASDEPWRSKGLPVRPLFATPKPSTPDIIAVANAYFREHSPHDPDAAPMSGEAVVSYASTPKHNEGREVAAVPKPGSLVWNLSTRIGDLTAENTLLRALVTQPAAPNHDAIRLWNTRSRGTVEQRFSNFMAELDKRFPKGAERRNLCAEPPESDLLREIDAYIAQTIPPDAG